MATIELFTVANHAEAINGLLYLSGGGWSQIRRMQNPDGTVGSNRFAVAFYADVRWEDAGKPIPMRMQIVDSENNLATQFEGTITADTPPVKPENGSLRVVLSLDVNIVFGKTGLHRMTLFLDDDEAEVEFYVYDMVQTGA